MTDTLEKSEYLLPSEVANILRVQVATLAHWRWLWTARGIHRGPTWIKVDGNVRYARTEVEKYLSDSAQRHP